MNETEIKLCHNFRTFFKLYNRGVRQILCEKMKTRKSSQSPKSKIRKRCHTIPEGYNFFTGRKFIQQTKTKSTTKGNA